MASSSRTLEEACDSLTLLEDEENGLEFGEDDLQLEYEEHKFTLVGRLLTEKPFEFHILRDTMAAVWRPKKGMSAKEITTNLFYSSFFMRLI